jgi:nucleoside-diphosphate-sugar epimerase
MDDGPLHEDSRGSGPYVWGKLESERLALELGRELGVDVKVVRPGPIVDFEAIDPPGRLGKRVGGVFVAVGSPGQRLATTELRYAARALEWMVRHWSEVPSQINLLDPDSPTRRELLQLLRRQNPRLSVVWLPTVVLLPLSWLATALQKARNPDKPATSLAKAFASQPYDTTRSRSVAAAMESSGPGASASRI